MKVASFFSVFVFLLPLAVALPITRPVEQAETQVQLEGSGEDAIVSLHASQRAEVKSDRHEYLNKLPRTSMEMAESTTTGRVSLTDCIGVACNPTRRAYQPSRAEKQTPGATAQYHPSSFDHSKAIIQASDFESLAPRQYDLTH